MRTFLFISICCLVSACSKDDFLDASQATYDNLTFQEIVGQEGAMSDALINSTHGDANEMYAGTILVFKTGDGNYGKLRVFNNTEEGRFLEFTYQLFDERGDLIIESEFTSVQQTFTFNFEGNNNGDIRDFWWEWNEFNNGGMDGEDKFLVPLNGTIFHVFLNE